MQNQELFVSVMTLGEIRKGIDLLSSRDAPQSRVLEGWLRDVEHAFRERLIEVQTS
jgi:hypothetical protein